MVLDYKTRRNEITALFGITLHAHNENIKMFEVIKQIIQSAEILKLSNVKRFAIHFVWFAPVIDYCIVFPKAETQRGILFIFFV